MAWQYGGDQVQRARQRAGVTRQELAEASHYDIESIRSMEAGRRKPTLQMLRAADELCDAKGMLIAAAEFMEPEKFPTYSKDYTDTEREAIAIQGYEALLIPGLLQTEEYAREQISHSFPPLDDETVETRVAARLQRQDKLRHSPTTMFGFVIYEVALRTVIGDAGLMKRQLEQLLDVCKLRNVAIQVLPVNRAIHVAMEGPMMILETPEHKLLGYVEGQYAGILSADPEKVSILAQRHAMIRSQALSIEESEAFIRTVMEEL
ncbi:Scr1 family TA system antitoxin-like transcriptional regulator [Kitasatospora sp. NPDC048286]|uniref:helix-turn-helix domain-containing protein n=1 Tax=Kitasatospora sp. NPDC048286 TaxID=3364047 RepID=UPI003712B8E7